MARIERIPQNDFSLGSARPEAIERDDTDLIEKGLWESDNTIVLTTGQLEGRPGSLFVDETEARSGTDIDLGSGREFDLHIVSDGIRLFDKSGSEEVAFGGNDWTALPSTYGTPVFEDMKFWVVSDPDTSSILIGSRSVHPHVLQVDSAGVWTFGLFDFATTLAGAKQQPYFNFDAGVTIQPSARSGISITVTSAPGIFTPDHVGMRIRYVDREIVLTGYTNATTMTASVTEELPPTYDITMAGVSGYQVGEAVEHSTLGGQGVIVDIFGNQITVLATSLWDGFDGSGKLIAPNANSDISSIADGSPAATVLWDMQLLSKIKGYPGWAAKHKGRLFMCDFPSTPQVYAAGAAGLIDDFLPGTSDGDAFVETIGVDSGGELRYVVSAEDLLFLTSRGLFYQQTRDGSAITPSTIAPIRFSPVGAARVSPASVDEGAIFVDSVGGQVYAANLSGDVRRSWRADNIGVYHPHLINNPTYLGIQAIGDTDPETFIYVINEDGKAAVGQWKRSENQVGWRPWYTQGKYVSIYNAFGRAYAVVDRIINGVPKRFYECFERGIYVDCAAVASVDADNLTGFTGADYFAGTTSFALHMIGHTASVYFERWDMGDLEIDGSGKPLVSAGTVLEYPAYEGLSQVGLFFPIKITPWPRRSAQTQRGRRTVKRLVKIGFVFQDTLAFEFAGESFGAYRVSEDLTLPPRLRSEEVEFVPGGREPFEKRVGQTLRPGPLRLLKINYRVTV